MTRRVPASPATIHRHLDALGIAYRTVEHAPTPTSADAAKARGEPLANGAKALVVKVDDDFRVFVLSAAAKLDSKAIKRRFAARSIRFATPEELLERTGLVPGSVPPFGAPILPFDLCLESGILARERVAFNAASLTSSIVMDRADYVRAAKPVETFEFARA